MKVSVVIMLVMCVFAHQEEVQASCPSPHATSTVWALNLDPLSAVAEVVLRATHATSGDYALIVRDAIPVFGNVIGLPFTATHSLLGAFALSAARNYRPSDIDAVDIGGNGARRWIVDWNASYPAPLSRPQRRFRSFNLPFSSPQSFEYTLIDPYGVYDQSRGGSLDLLPSSRRTVHVMTLEKNRPGWCGTEEARAIIHMRESATLNVVPGMNETLVSSNCSYNSLHQGNDQWGQEFPDVSTNWFFGDFFVVSWYERAGSDYPYGGSLVPCGVYARVFDGNGSPITSEILIDIADSTCTSGQQIAPRVAAAPGGFMVTWTRTDGTLWMRTFNIAGTPFISARQVAPGGAIKGVNPDIDWGLGDPCGSGYANFFAISWWGQTTSNGPWTPRMMVFKDLANPLPIIPGAGYLPLDGLTQPNPHRISDRVSIDFFSNPAASDSACTNLTLGAAWTIENGSGLELIRKRFITFQPLCEGHFSTKASEFLLDTREPAADCVEPLCFGYTPWASPTNEPDGIFPDE